MAAKKMTPAQAQALKEAGKFFGDSKLGKKRIAEFKKTLADGYAGLTVNPQTKPKNSQPLTSGQREAKPKTTRVNPLTSAQREAKPKTTRPGRGAR